MNKKLKDLCLREARFKCELCGSTRSVDVHHIVPVVAGGEDVRDNLIVVCQKCHGLLTPRSYLTKYGQKKVVVTQQLLNCETYQDAYYTLLNFCVNNYWGDRYGA